MNKKFKAIWAFALSAVMLLTVIAFGACSCNGNDDDLPEPTYVDKSGLAYASALDAYKKTDFTGSWIWTDVTAPDSYVAFRKTFELDSAPASATAYISAESKYFMWVNGVLTVYDGSLKRGATPYDGYYDTITVDNLKAGKNTIAFLVAYNGRSGDSSIDPEQGGLLFEMEAGGVKVVSDKSFKVMRLREYKNQSLLKGDYPGYKQSSMLAERNIYYDARDSVGDFTAEGYDDSSWEAATRVCKPGAQPFNDLYSAPTPPIAFGEIVDYENSAEHINKTFTTATTITLDLPLNRQFSPYFELEGKAGSKLTYYTDTYEVGKGTTEYNFKDTYVCSDGAQSYENYPWRSGAKLFIEVPSGVKFTRLGYRPSGYASKATGSFTSSDDALDTLWQKSLNTLEITMRDTFMDCPDRERAPYMGDSTNEVDMTFYAMDTDSYGLIKKGILSSVGWTKTDKCIPSRSPSIKPHEIPAQSLAFMTAAYNYYLYSGDAETLKVYYPAAIEYLKLWKLKDNGMIENRAGSWVWIDWGTGQDSEVIQNCWYYYAADCMDKLADGLGITKDKEFLAARKKSLKDNFAKVFKVGNAFSSGKDYDDRANALAVVSGLADESDYSGIKDVLTTVKQASPFMEKYVLQALCEMGEYSAAKSRMLGRYGGMIYDECTTLWELWDKDAGSINHGWTGGTMVVMSKYFAGIRPTSTAYNTFEICPQDVLDEMNATVDTVIGKISVSVQRSATGATLTVNVPTGGGTLKLPSSLGTSATVTGGSYEALTVADGCAFKLTAAGTYTIIASV